MTCVINAGTGNPVTITFQHPPGATAQAEAQLQQDVQRVLAECQRATGSARFRQAVKNIGNFILHVERSAGIGYGSEGPPGVPNTGRDAPGKAVYIDVGDHDRAGTNLTGGDQANRDAVRATQLLYTLVHEIIGEELPGHDHTVINNDVITVVRDQLGIQVTQLGDCKAKQIGGQAVQVFNWSVIKPGNMPVLVQENITATAANGSRLVGCSVVGGVARLPEADGSPAQGAGPGGGPGAAAALAAGAAGIALGLAGLAWVRRARPGTGNGRRSP